MLYELYVQFSDWLNQILLTPYRWCNPNCLCYQFSFEDLIIYLLMQFQLVIPFAIAKMKSFDVKMGDVFQGVWFVMNTMTVGISLMKDKIVVSKNNMCFVKDVHLDDLSLRACYSQICT